MTLAGTPPTTVRGATSFVTTAPAATTAPSPMVTPGSMEAWSPIHTSFPIVTGRKVMDPLFSGSMSWFIVAMDTWCPTSVPSPSEIPPWSWKVHPLLMNTFLPTEMLSPKSVWNGGKRANPSPWYGYQIRQASTGKYVQLGTQFEFGSNTNTAVNPTSANWIVTNQIAEYHFHVTYDPTLFSNTFVARELISNRTIFTSNYLFPDLPELRYLTVCVGCALDENA